MCACVCVCVRARARVCVCVCVRAHARACCNVRFMANHCATRCHTHTYPQVSNNGLDFTFDRSTYDVTGPCPPGRYCPGNDLTSVLLCPRGTYCPGTGNQNVTLCPRGMYQPLQGQSDCLR